MALRGRVMCRCVQADVNVVDVTDKMTVLVVDDDPLIRSELQCFFEQRHHTVFTAHTGLSGLEAAQRHTPQIVLSDWHMPGLNGPDLCRKIRENEAFGFTYIILMTNDESSERLIEAFRAGADDFITKPIDQRILQARLRAARRIVNLERDLEERSRQVMHYSSELEVANRLLEDVIDRLNRRATTDELTELPNRRAAMEHFTRLWAASSREGSPLACMMIDFDHFKKCNDEYGHAAGDAVLKTAARLFEQCSRTNEQVFRIGGEEFLCICANATAQEVLVGAERMRQAIESLVIKHDAHELKITTSIGVAQREPAMQSYEDLLAAADEALYRAKRTGRNRVCVAKSEDESDTAARQSA
jgi:two-component system cell cycle response regulator